MRTTLNGIEVEYSIDGDSGPWLVMSHSLGCDMAMWDPQMPALTGRYRVLRYDTRGHGRSEATAGPYTLDQLADDAAALMKHVGIRSAVWVGFSMGGMIGQTFALKHPSLTQAVVLADTTSEHHATPHSVWDERIRVALEQGMAPLVQPAIGRWFTQAYRERQPERVAAVARTIGRTSVDGWAGCCAAISGVNTTSRLHEIACPVLVIVGEHDIGTPLASALTIHRALPDSVLAVVSDAAHMTCIEQPSQFNRVLRQFLDARVALHGSTEDPCIP
ncbi:MAG: 3-oxoadipate enol-lactonase [Hydrogenophaga sp.]|uniref:3-oxoadipate enol-lactonase n=1 Tax=Hydrogenophaga sp. TaxID=1904254 RepID=UPI0025BF997A|nr:3-oxoadipate enol-lactonase [Hydrogenophaga sp.]MBT9549961.1 3-oxoadipate enol-lactonase [Hydrogenophaga sp.]